MPNYVLIVSRSTGLLDAFKDISSSSLSIPYHSSDSHFIFVKSLDSEPVVGDSIILTYAEKRACDYKIEADHLFFAWQGTENDASSTQEDKDASKQVWLDKRSTIKTRYPKS